MKNKNKKKPKRFGNTHLQGLVTSGELESGLEFLEKMVLGGVDIPDVDSCATMIHWFCEIGETTKAVRVLVLLEESGLLGMWSRMIC